MSVERFLIRPAESALAEKLRVQGRACLVPLPALELRAGDEYVDDGSDGSGYGEKFSDGPIAAPDGQTFYIYHVRKIMPHHDSTPVIRFFISQHHVLDGHGVYWRVPYFETSDIVYQNCFHKMKMYALDANRMGFLHIVNGRLTQFELQCNPDQPLAAVARRIVPDANLSYAQFLESQLTGHICGYSISDLVIFRADIEATAEPHYCRLRDFGDVLRSRLDRRYPDDQFRCTSVTLGYRGVYAIVENMGPMPRVHDLSDLSDEEMEDISDDLTSCGSDGVLDVLCLAGFEWEKPIEHGGCWCTRRCEDARLVVYYVSQTHCNIPHNHPILEKDARSLQCLSQRGNILMRDQYWSCMPDTTGSIKKLYVSVLDPQDVLQQSPMENPVLRNSLTTFKLPLPRSGHVYGYFDTISDYLLLLYKYPSGQFTLVRVHSAFPRLAPSAE